MCMSNKYQTIKENDYQQVAGEDWPTYDDFIKGIDVPDYVYQEIDSLLWKTNAQDRSNFCVLPFYGVELPLNIICCAMKGNARSRHMIQTDMLNNIRAPECRTCWENEDAGLLSDRQIKNSGLDHYLDKDLELIFQECVEQKNTIVNYKIDTNNVCDATCVTCNSNLSSAWAKLEKENGVQTRKTWQIFPDSISNNVDYSTAKTIGFRGGEPTLSKTNFVILEKLIEHNNLDCFISFTTNGNFNLSDYQVDLLLKFNNLNFNISIDGIGPVFEYMRFPIKWDTVLKNIEWCRQNNIMVSSTCTISNVNVLYYSETINWFKENNIPYYTVFVTNPVYLSVSNLPQLTKSELAAEIPELAGQLRPTAVPQNTMYQKFLQTMKRQDSWKNIKMKDYLPRLDKILNQS